MNITVLATGTRHTLVCAPADTIRELKKRLAPLTAIAAAEMRLVAKGKTLDDDIATLASFGVTDGAKIMLIRTASTQQLPPPAWRIQLVDAVGDAARGAAAWLLPLLSWEALKQSVLGFCRGVGKFFTSMLLTDEQRREHQL